MTLACSFFVTVQPFFFYSVADEVSTFVRSPDVKLLLAWLAKVFTGLPHGKVCPAPSELAIPNRLRPDRQSRVTRCVSRRPKQLRLVGDNLLGVLVEHVDLA